MLFTVLVIPLVLSTSVLPLLKNIPYLPAFVYSGPGALVLQALLGALDGTLLFGAIYFVVPNRRQRLRDVVPGAVVAGVLIEAITLLWPLYFQVSNGFATYGKTFALFFLLVSYFYLLGQVLVVGATVNAEVELTRDAQPAAPMRGLSPAPDGVAGGRRRQR